MYPATCARGRCSALRRGILFLLVFVMTAVLFGTVLAAPADAASYKVKAWSSDGFYSYYVYQGSLPQHYEYYPTFYRSNSDVFKSGNMKFSFYSPFVNADAETATALQRYQINKAGNSMTAGWYSVYSAEDYWYYVYKIDGWRCDRDSLDKLLRHSPFTNPDGQKLYLEYIGRGNVVNSKWSEINGSRQCSAAVYFPETDATIGFRFVSEYGNAFTAYGG